MGRYQLLESIKNIFGKGKGMISSKYTCDYCMEDGWEGKYFSNNVKIENYDTANELVEHVRTTHPERWPSMLPYVPGDIHNKAWQPQEIQAVRDLYLEIRATQGVGTQLVVTYDKDKNIIDAQWNTSTDKPESDMSVHARAMNKASVTLNRSPKTIRDILNGRFGNPIILEKTGNGVGKTQLTGYASNVVRQIQEENGWVTEEESVHTPVEILDCQTKQTEVTDPEPDTQLAFPDFELNDTVISEWVNSTSSILTKVRELQHVQKEIQNKNKKIQSLEELIEQLNTQVSDLTEELSSLKNFYLVQTPQNTSTLTDLSKKLNELANQVNNELNR